MKNNCLLVLGVFLLGGCGKDEETPLVLTGEYQLGPTIVATSPMVMYTMNGPINDQPLIAKFLRRTAANTPLYFSNTDVPVPAGNALTLTIGADNQARLTSASPNGALSLQAEVTARTAHEFVLSDIDSVLVGFYNGPGSNRCEVLIEKIKAVYPEKHCSLVSVGSGVMGRSCKVRPVHVVTIRDGKLFVPQFSWLIKTGYGSFPTTLGSACTYARNGDWNRFNPASQRELTAGDTLLVQSREIALLKK